MTVSVTKIGSGMIVSGRRAAILVLPSSAWRALGLTSKRASPCAPDSPCSSTMQRATPLIQFHSADKLDVRQLALTALGQLALRYRPAGPSSLS